MEIALVYMVAGLSSRFQGKIKHFAKIGPNQETLIEYSLKQALPAGFTKIIFIVGEKTEKPFKEMFKDSYQGIPIQYSLQQYDKKTRDKPWGTVDALCSVNHLIKSPLIVCNGDDLYGAESFRILTEHLKDNNHDATIGYKLSEVLPENGKVNRAIFQVDNHNQVKDLKEVFNLERNNHQARGIHENDLCSMNLYALYPKTIEKLNIRLNLFKLANQNHRTAECLLPNEISTLIKSNQIKMKLYPTPSKWHGVTNPEDEEIIRRKLKNLPYDV